ncbi:hypothetical protein BpHYR1_008958 [Brachionus plicatilis]|uniref:Uncharacterized protein n=1 Tax=Brachionus plicatilis TaxID=10195 RepID=A0A3M7SDJ2_BRAPC|nr:hypothetical protein BpHYR1_008958 [Brachionus plicatilis]
MGIDVVGRLMGFWEEFEDIDETDALSPGVNGLCGSVLFIFWIMSTSAFFTKINFSDVQQILNDQILDMIHMIKFPKLKTRLSRRYVSMSLFFKK